MKADLNNIIRNSALLTGNTKINNKQTYIN